MISPPPQSGRRVFFVMNNKSGNADQQAVRAAVARHLGARQDGFDFFVRDRKGQSRRKATRKAIAEEFDLVVAVGGDGTVSRVADELRGTGISLGIVPTGSANLIARSLSLPLDPEEAIRVVADSPARRSMDAMLVEDRAYFSHVSMGVYSQIAGDTTTQQKQRFGTAAYAWHMMKALKRRQRWRFEMTIDGVQIALTASMIIACNVGDSGIAGLQWDERIEPDDGRIDLCAIRSASPATYLQLIGNAMLRRQPATPEVQYLHAFDQISIRCEDHLPVRGDGKAIGHNRANISVLRDAVQVVVPRSPDELRD